MARARIQPNPENASLHDLKEAARVGSVETALRCTALQMLITGIAREQVCASLLVSDRALLKWVRLFNESGIDGLLVVKRPGRPPKIPSDQTPDLRQALERPEEAQRTFWTARAFHGYIQEKYKTDCSYSTVVRFFHQQK